MCFKHDVELFDREYEEWKVVPGFPDYRITKNGDICGPGRSGNGHIMKPTKGKNGHMYVTLKNGNSKEKQYVHRLVAQTFISNPNNYPVVRHLDDDPSYNYVDNLAWGTQPDNIQDMRDLGHNYVWSDEDREKAYRKRRTPVIAINLQTGEEKKFISQNEASRKLNISQTAISDLVRGKPGHKQVKGYTFKYEKEAL